jgi:hypothetical protein
VRAARCALQTGDPIKGWEAGLTWVCIQSFVVMIGGFVGPIIRRVTPRAALLGTLAAVSLTFISMRPAPIICEGQKEITALGGWRSYVASRS